MRKMVIGTWCLDVKGLNRKRFHEKKKNTVTGFTLTHKIGQTHNFKSFANVLGEYTSVHIES